MSEVEKMYENAGIEKCNSSLKDIIPSVCLKNNEDENYKCEDCEYNWYPNFTAEKQLELVKWCCKRCRRFYIYNINDIDNFAENLAKEFNHYWQDLIDQERTEIAEILKG